jgi:hypothetical protein
MFDSSISGVVGVVAKPRGFSVADLRFRSVYQTVLLLSDDEKNWAIN